MIASFPRRETRAHGSIFSSGAKFEGLFNYLQRF